MDKSGGLPPPYPGPEIGPPQPNVMMVPPQPMIVGAPTIVVETPMGSQPTPYTCRSCNQHIVTRVDRKPVTKTHLFALLLCAIGCWPCVCVPYCMDSCKSADHYCTNCGAFIGSYKQ